jgi:hypothetical protein
MSDAYMYCKASSRYDASIPLGFTKAHPPAQ